VDSAESPWWRDLLPAWIHRADLGGTGGKSAEA